MYEIFNDVFFYFSRTYVSLIVIIIIIIIITKITVLISIFHNIHLYL